MTTSGNSFFGVGFTATTLTGTNRAVVRFYNQGGTAEQWIKEGKASTLLGVIAYNHRVAGGRIIYIQARVQSRKTYGDE